MSAEPLDLDEIDRMLTVDGSWTPVKRDLMAEVRRLRARERRMLAAIDMA